MLQNRTLYGSCTRGCYDMNEHDHPWIILYYRKTGKYALNVLTGTLEQAISNCALPVELLFANNNTELTSLLQSDSCQRRKTVVCWSFYSPDFESVVSELGRLKETTKTGNILHIAGGVHCSARPAQTLQAGFDFAAVGEGETIIAEIARRLAGGQALRGIQGLHYLDGQTWVNQHKGRLIDLDDYPPCGVEHKKFGAIEITRGCLYGCRFCQTPHFHKARFRHRSIDNILHYVRIMKQNHLRDYRFISPSSMSYGSEDTTVNLEAIERLLASIRAEIGPQRRLFYGTFPSEIRPEHITPDSLHILKKYTDNDNLIIGGQSGSEAMLRTCRRGHDVDVIVEAVTHALRFGFTPNVDFMYGMPGETQQDADASIRLAQKLAAMGARIHNHFFMPLPGTPFQYATPAPISRKTLQALNLLHSRGHAYGKVIPQIELSRKLQHQNKTPAMTEKTSNSKGSD